MLAMLRFEEIRECSGETHAGDFAWLVRGNDLASDTLSAADLIITAFANNVAKSAIRHN
ncbi:MAG TPA: hypothetical protein VGJ26_10195 [Pirellulales bacterium]